MCASWSAVRLIQAYYEPITVAVVEPLACQSLTNLSGVSAPWQIGLIEYIYGSLSQAQQDLDSVLSEQSDAARMRLLDQLLTFAPVAWSSHPARSDWAVAFAQRYLHASPVGYLRLAQFYLAQANAGDTFSASKSLDVFRLAGETSAHGYLPMISRAQAWFFVGEFLKTTDTRQALTAYLAAIAMDPRDESGGYAWMSSMNSVELYVKQQNWAAAREMLAYAATLPDLYHRYSYTRLRLAQLEFELGELHQAINILEQAIVSEPDFVLTRLNLAELYTTAGRLQDAIAQYIVVLQLDSQHAQARQALSALEGK
jgi:tetratricopeptide (TPR) repeat protein